MEIQITGKNIEITQAIRSAVEGQIEKLNKYVEDVEPVRVDVVIKSKTQGAKGEPRSTVEVTMRVADQVVRVEETAEDLYEVIDAMEEKLERKLRSHKERLLDERRASGEVSEKDIQRIVRRKKIDLGSPISEDEAIARMDLLGHDFYIYLDKDLAVQRTVYRRKDGGYGVIE